jgi:endonuclease/exonuclease/phosphatase family metal-dependent hydrolase
MNRAAAPLVTTLFACLSAASVALAQGTAAPASPPRVATAEANPSPGELRVGSPAAKPRTPGTIRLASYNIENLFDAKDDPRYSGDLEDLDDHKPESQRAGVEAAMRAIDADVVSLQEIESYDALVEFRDQHLKGMGYDHVVSIDAGDPRGIEQSVLSRFPIKDPKVWLGLPLEGKGHPEFFPDGGKVREFGTPFDLRRSPLRVTVEVPADKTGAGKGYDLTLFIVHHKSGRGYTYWREAEARKVVELYKEFVASNPSANVAVLGDFNAGPDESPVKVYLDAGFVDINADRKAGDKTALTHASERTIDLILVNANLKAELAMDSRFILATPQLPKEADWRTAPKPSGYASDHSPVVVDVKPRDE